MHSQVLSFGLWVKSLRWLGRAGSIAVIVLLFLFLVGETNHDSLPLRARDLVGLSLFPVGVVLGMLVSWKYEIEGALLSIGCLIGFYVICEMLVGNTPDGWAFVIFTSPAFLFLVSGSMDRLRAGGVHSQLHHP